MKKTIKNISWRIKILEQTTGIRYFICRHIVWKVLGTGERFLWEPVSIKRPPIRLHITALMCTILRVPYRIEGPNNYVSGVSREQIRWNESRALLPHCLPPNNK